MTVHPASAADGGAAAGLEAAGAFSTDGAGGTRRRPGVAVLLARRVGGGVVQGVLVLIALFWLMPTLGLFLASLRSEQDNSAGGWWTALTRPAQITLDNYRDLLADGGFFAVGGTDLDAYGSFWNTVLIAVPSTLLVVGIAALAGYAFAWLEFPGRDWLFLIIVTLLVVPVQVGLIPAATLFRVLGIYGELPGVILFHVAFGLPFAIFLLRNFFAAIPRDLLEAARMDGGSEWTILRRVVFPLGGPAIASLGIFQFLWVWNDMLVALVFAKDNQPMTVALQSQMRQFGGNIDILAPGAFLSLIIPLAVFFTFQRYFVQGVLAGSVK